MKRLVRKQLLIYQGHTPSARHPLRLVGKELHPSDRIFFLLERQVGMTHKQIVKKLVHSVRTDMRHNQFGKEYSSDSEGDGPWQIPGLRNWDEDSGECIFRVLIRDILPTAWVMVRCGFLSP